MALEEKDFRENIVSKELIFNDEYYSLKSKLIGNEDGIHFIAYEALKDVNDVKTNNFSNIILTKKQKNSDILSSKEIIQSEFNDFVTTLSFFSPDSKNELNPGVWFTIDKGYDTYEVDTTTSSFKLVEGAPDDLSSFLFRIKCINETICQISHNFGDSSYYLVYDNGFKTVNAPSNENGDFIYFIEDNLLKLYKLNDGILYQVICKKSGNNWIIDLSDAPVDERYCLLYVNNKKEHLKNPIDSSWIRYDRSNSIDAVDIINSVSELDSQFLIHHEYSDTDDNVNLIPLKNHLTYQGTVTNGSNLTLSNNGKFIHEPIVDFRNYTNIHSGINQELGNENIILTFNFTDQVYHLNPGDDCIFTLPDYSEEDGEISPIYPYKTLNINDSCFARNGAFGSDIPYFADKFKRYQNNTDINGSSYLCSWLYQKDSSSEPVWLDRYYYPDFSSRKKALSGEVFGDSFNNILDEHYFNETSFNQFDKSHVDVLSEELARRPYFDKKSDLIIEGGSTYKYSRVSNDMVKEVLKNNAADRIEEVRDQNSNKVSLEQIFSFNGENWRKIESSAFKGTKSFNFNTNLYINPKKKMGIQLFGCDYKFGFNIQNRKDLSPFSYYATEETVYMLNNQFEVANQFNLKEKYGESITYLVTGAPFDNVYLFTSKSMFIFDYDLSIKNRVELKQISSAPYFKNLSETHIISYNGELYAVINKGSDIVKIWFDDTMGWTAEKLPKSSYITNFNSQDTSGSDDGSLVQTAHIIKSIYKDENGLFAFNYDIAKMSHDGDTLYGIIEQKSSVDLPWYYIYNQSLSKLHADSASSKYAEFSSETSINTIAYGPNGNFALIRGFQMENNEHKCLEIYDKSKTKIYNIPLSAYNKCISLDFYRYIDNNFEEQDAFIALLGNGDHLAIVEYQINQQRTKSYFTSLSAKNISTFRGIINSNAFINRLSENKLYFNLYPIDETQPITHEWDLATAQEGWYNINVEVDIDNARFIIKINDIINGYYDANTPGISEKFIKYRNDLNSPFDGSYYYGVLGKKHGSTLGEILYPNLKYDPYVINHSKTENTTIYKRKLGYYEYQAMRLRFAKINPLVITLPCGIRNGVEEIIRYFKYATPGAISNSVKINISGIDNQVFLEKDLEQLRKYIMDSLSSTDYLTTIKEIEFI